MARSLLQAGAEVLMLTLLFSAAMAAGPMTPEPEPPPLIPTPVPWVAVLLMLVAVYGVVRLASRPSSEDRGSR